MTPISSNACKSAGNQQGAKPQSNDEGFGSLDSNYGFRHNGLASSPWGEA